MDILRHQEDSGLLRLLALLMMHSSGFSAPGTSDYAFVKILSSWHFSLCFHQDSGLLALLIMHSSGFSAGILGGSGKLPSPGATPPQRNKSQRATTHQMASRFSSDPARSKGVRFSLPYERHSRGGRLDAKNPFLKSRFIDPGFCDFQQYIFNLLTCSEYRACTCYASASW